MEKLIGWLNTGRRYTANGQEVMFLVREDGSASFVDIDRGIEGEVGPVDLINIFGEPREAWEIGQDVFLRYDLGNYTGVREYKWIQRLWDFRRENADSWDQYKVKFYR